MYPQRTGLPPSVEPATYHTRVIVRDVTGKYVWDCAMLYGPQMFPHPGETTVAMPTSYNTNRHHNLFQLRTSNFIFGDLIASNPHFRGWTMYCRYAYTGVLVSGVLIPGAHTEFQLPPSFSMIVGVLRY